MRKVRINKMPKKNNPTGASGNMIYPMYNPNQMAAPKMGVRNTLGPVPEEDSNLEAEKGETAYIPNVNGMAAHYKIGGKRHSEGGTPLDLPDDAFIFSDTRGMKIKDPNILKFFGKSEKQAKKGFTPAELAEKYDINTYRKILADPDSDKLMIETAEKMIANYNMKLGKLALVQEASKGFPQGIPAIALPYLMTAGLSPEQILPLTMPQDEQTEDVEAEDVTDQYAQYGTEVTSFMQNGGPYSTAAAKLDEEVKAKLKKEKEDAANKKAEFDAKQKLKGDLYSYSNSTKRNEKYLKELYKKYENAQYNRVHHGYEPWVNPESPENLLKQINQLEKSSISDKEKLGRVQKVMFDINMQKNISEEETGPSQWVQNPDGTWTQKSGKTKPVPVGVTPTVTDTTGNAAILKLWQKQYGGSFQYMQKGGHKSQTVNGIESRMYDDGTITKIVNGKESVVKAGDPNWKEPTTTTTGKTSVSKSKTKTYKTSEDPEILKNLFKKYNIASDPYIFEGEIGSQHKTKNTPGYGEQVTLDQWKKNNAWYIAEHPDFNPDNKADVGNYEVALRAKNKAALLQKNPKMTETELNTILDATSFINDPTSIRHADQKMGDYHKSRMALQFNDAPIVPGKTDVVDEVGDYAQQELKGLQGSPNAPWWLQDVVKTAGAAGDFARIKKYLPWAPKVNPYIPEPTFYDPTRELAANAEQSAIATQGVGAFARPQDLSSRMSQIQGQGAKNAASILARYNNQNVSAANQFNALKGDIMNKVNMTNAGLATKLYDQTTMANQQFDNAKNMARQELRQSYIDAVTNRAQTQAMNTLYPHYQVDPITGGFTTFEKGSKLKPGKPQMTQEDMKAHIDTLIAQGWTPTEAMKYLGAVSGGPEDEEDPNAIPDKTSVYGYPR